LFTLDVLIIINNIQFWWFIIILFYFIIRIKDDLPKISYHTTIRLSSWLYVLKTSLEDVITNKKSNFSIANSHTLKYILALVHLVVKKLRTFMLKLDILIQEMHY